MTKRIRRIVGEIKCTKELKPKHIRETVRKYHWPFSPDEYEYIIPRHTKVSKEARKLAIEKKGKVRRCWGFP